MSQADFWNERYSQEAFAYGTEPNQFFKEQLSSLPAGTLLLPAEGEGRNAVFAAGLGWKIAAFDQSPQGKRKAELLAESRNLGLDYQVCDWQETNYLPASFDAIALIFAHMPAGQKKEFHSRMCSFLKPGGIIILEAFSKNQPEWQAKNPAAGGPREPGMLYSTEEIRHDFQNFEPLLLEEKVVNLKEGPFHNSFGSVIRFQGMKKQTTL